MKAVDQCGGVHLQAIGQTQQAAQAQVPLPPLDRTDKGEVQPDALGQGHLTHSQLHPPPTGSLANRYLGWSSFSETGHHSSQRQYSLER